MNQASSVEVCFDDISITTQLPRDISSTCSHVRDVLYRSTYSSSRHKLPHRTGTPKIPQHVCQTILSHSDLQTFASPKDFLSLVKAPSVVGQWKQIRISFLAALRIFLMVAFSMGNPVRFSLNVVHATPTTGLQCRTADHSRLSTARISEKSRHAPYIVPQSSSKTKG